MAEFEFLTKKRTVEMQVILTDSKGEVGFYERQRGFIEELKSSLGGFTAIRTRCTMAGQTVITMYVEFNKENFSQDKVRELEEKYFPKT